jgi:hypothetical protein
MFSISRSKIELRILSLPDPWLPGHRKNAMLRSFRVFPLLISAVALGACPAASDAIIHYTQLGACTQAKFPNGNISVQSNHAIALFKVSSVDNSQVNATWSYNANNFWVTPPSSWQVNLGSIGPITIAANQNVTVNSLVGNWRL